MVSLLKYSEHPTSCARVALLINVALINSEPTVFENYVHDLYVDEQLVELSLWDTAGTSSHSLRVFVIMLSVPMKLIVGYS